MLEYEYSWDRVEARHVCEPPSYPSHFSSAAGIFLLPYLGELTSFPAKCLLANHLAVLCSRRVLPKTVRYRYFISNLAEDAREGFLPDPHIAGAGCYWTKRLRPATKGVNGFQLSRELEEPTTALPVIMPCQRGDAGS